MPTFLTSSFSEDESVSREDPEEEEDSLEPDSDSEPKPIGWLGLISYTQGKYV